MAEKHEGKGGKILHMTVKRARRVQEKMLQKLGKSDQTRDEVFEEFVANFNKQHACAVKLQKEMTKYMNNIRVLYQNTKSMSDTLKELYEDDWGGCEKQRDLMEQRILLWEDLLTSLTSRTVEPMTNYLARFADVKGRIQKRERKVVDYDLRRRELEHAKSKVKVNDQKILQAEETHTLAKQFYDEIADELYEELPTLYDSRIQFYAQIFQSIAASEARFHSEVGKIDEDLARVMDGLASQAATGVHSTKKQRSVLTTPKLLSRPGEEDSDDDSEEVEVQEPSSHSPSLDQSHLSPTPTHTTENSIDPDEVGLSPSVETSSEQTEPPKPLPFRDPVSTGGEEVVTSSPTATQSEQSEGKSVTSPCDDEEKTDDRDAIHSPAVDTSSENDDRREQEVVSPFKTPPPKPAPLDQPPESQQPLELNEDKEKVIQPPDDLLYTVIATHLYHGEDEDELTFEKGDIVYVVPYEDAEDEEEGWCMGICQSNGDKGIFPENFTKRQ